FQQPSARARIDGQIRGVEFQTIRVTRQMGGNGKRTDTAAGQACSMGPLRKTVQRGGGHLEGTVHQTCSGKTGGTLKGQLGRRRIEGKGKRRIPTTQKKKRLGRAGLDGDTFALPDSPRIQRCLPVQRWPVECSGETADDIGHLVACSRYDAGFYEFDLSQAVG